MPLLLIVFLLNCLASTSSAHKYAKNVTSRSEKSIAIFMHSAEYKYENSSFKVNICIVCITKSIKNANSGINATLLFFISCDKNINNIVAINTKIKVTMFVKSNINILFPPIFSFVSKNILSFFII